MLCLNYKWKRQELNKKKKYDKNREEMSKRDLLPGLIEIKKIKVFFSTCLDE